MELTVVLTNYLRPANIQKILAALATQTVRHRLFVWDNSPDQSCSCPRADWIIRSTLNAKCGARWWLAAHADTPWVVVMDDDLAPLDERVLADTLAKLAQHQPAAIGATGVVLDPDQSYFDCQHVGLGCQRIESDTPVGILKGRYLALATKRLEQLKFMPLDSEDDIIASASVGGGVVVASLQDRFKELSTGPEARFRRSIHRHAREITRRQYICSPQTPLDIQSVS